MAQETVRNEDIPWAWIKAVNDIVTVEPWDSEEQPVEILPWLYISDCFTVQNFDPVRGHGPLLEKQITHVLTTAAMPFTQNLKRKLAGAGIEHHAVEGQDEEGYDMLDQHWEECRAFVENVRTTTKTTNETKKVVVHCIAGQNRSGLVVAASMMVLERIPVLDVVRHIKAKRGIVLTNLTFQKELCMLAQKEGLLGDKPEGYSDEPIEYWFDK